MSRVVERDTSSAWFLGSLFRVDEARRYIVDKVLPHPWYRAICVAGADRPVGSISVNPADDLREPDESETGGLRSRCCRASVGYRVAHVHWGRGVVTRAVRATAEVVSAEWPWLERLAAVADVENPAGRRAAAKRSMVAVGRRREQRRWASVVAGCERSGSPKVDEMRLASQFNPATDKTYKQQINEPIG
uniref:OSJNBa0042D13.2 protein n=1 Tax=Oryza sativa subsp. japonica TaxID=39947 RepID=Q7F9E3_ORYSJ|nr:OSJNBa0042D13.2 [Oryza sativa Japonica Group]